MVIRNDPAPATAALRNLAPADRIAALADTGSVAAVDAALSAPRPSPHLARWGISPQNDDGVALARATLFDAPVFMAAQDERFLGGSAGANHADALRILFERARDERPAAVILLAASGGVRLYEANPAEWALARALSALLDARAAGVAVLSIGVADVFGGSAVLACAADRIALLPGTRLGVSGPKVIEIAHGRDELDASDGASVAAIFGAEARAGNGELDLIAGDFDAIRAWVASCLRDGATFAERVHAMQRRLDQRWKRSVDRAPAREVHNPSVEPPMDEAAPVDPARSLWRVHDAPVLVSAAAPGTFGPREAHALDAALLAQLGERPLGSGDTVILLENSRGHEATVAAERLCIAQYLAQHAAVIALLRSRGVQVIGVLTGTGHSAAFFANALQASQVYALPRSRVVVMEPAAIARVTRLDSRQVAPLVEDDSVLGHPVRHFARWGAIAAELPNASRTQLLALAKRRQ